jgi:hypothetical protein
MFGPKRDEVAGLGKRHSEELCDLYSSSDIVRMIKLRRMRWAVHVARMGSMKNTCKILLGKPEGNRLLERPKCRWKTILKYVLQE